jgi:hypothetical protein
MLASTYDNLLPVAEPRQAGTACVAAVPAGAGVREDQQL